MLSSEKVNFILSKTQYDFNDLCLILEILRGEGGCPWDAEQTHESIRKNFIEETYEVIEAIDTKNPELLREELGDVLLQVVFHAQMEKEAGTFDIDDVANDVCSKLVHRHPHIFSDVVAKTSEEVLSNWESIKNVEKSRETVYDKIKSVPPMLPALMRASKVSKKSGEYNSIEVNQQIECIHQLTSGLTPTEEKIGKLLFEICALSQKADIDPEEALFKYTNSFIRKYEN